MFTVRLRLLRQSLTQATNLIILDTADTVSREIVKSEDWRLGLTRIKGTDVSCADCARKQDSLEFSRTEYLGPARKGRAGLRRPDKLRSPPMLGGQDKVVYLLRTPRLIVLALAAESRF